MVKKQGIVIRTTGRHINSELSLHQRTVLGVTNVFRPRRWRMRRRRRRRRKSDDCTCEMSTAVTCK